MRQRIKALGVVLKIYLAFWRNSRQRTRYETSAGREAARSLRLLAVEHKLKYQRIEYLIRQKAQIHRSIMRSKIFQFISLETLREKRAVASRITFYRRYVRYLEALLARQEELRGKALLEARREHDR